MHFPAVRLPPAASRRPRMQLYEGAKQAAASGAERTKEAAASVSDRAKAAAAPAAGRTELRDPSGRGAL